MHQLLCAWAGVARPPVHYHHLAVAAAMLPVAPSWAVERP
jgi:hypothetical protein